jgi:hypothetical protein
LRRAGTAAALGRFEVSGVPDKRKSRLFKRNRPRRDLWSNREQELHEPEKPLHQGYAQVVGLCLQNRSSPHNRRNRLQRLPCTGRSERISSQATA